MVRICRRWTPGEDELIRVAAGANKAPRGYTADDFRAGDRHLPKVVDPGAKAGGYAGRLRAVAVQIGRTYLAVQQRAHRIGAQSREEEAMTALGPQGRRALRDAPALRLVTAVAEVPAVPHARRPTVHVSAAVARQRAGAAARIVELERENAELRAALAVAQRGAERAVEDGRRQERAQQARTMSGRVPSILTTLGGDR